MQNNIDAVLQSIITPGTDNPRALVRYVSEDSIKELARQIEMLLPSIVFASDELRESDACLEESALLAVVNNAESNKVVTAAQIKHARKKKLYESWRKILTEPLLEAKRKIDGLCNTIADKHEKEAARLGQLNSDFEMRERARVREEQEIQRKNLEAIERAMRAEIERIEAGKREKEREAIRARQEAERATAQATSEADRAAAKFAREESDRLARIATAAAATAEIESRHAQEQADQAARIEAKPIESTRSAGQIFADDWDFNVTLPYEAIKHYPDCFKTPEVLVGALKARIKAGLAFDKNYSMTGITFTKKLKANVRAGNGVVDV